MAFVISNIVKTSLPNYLSGLPVPDSIGGWFKLSIKEWIQLIPPGAVVAGISYSVYRAFFDKTNCSGSKSARANNKVRLDEKKVVDVINIEDIAEKVALCRCWKSNNWPYCDGSHGKHNEATGDNLGPALVKHK